MSVSRTRADLRRSNLRLVEENKTLAAEAKRGRTFAEAVALRIRDLNAEAEGASPTAVTIIRIRIDELQRVGFWLQERP